MLKTNPFCSTLKLAAQCLTLDPNLKMVWKKLPPGMGAGYDRFNNEIIMPAVDATELDENQARKLNAFCYHERLHHYLTDDIMIKALIYDNPKSKKALEAYYDDLNDKKNNKKKTKTPPMPKGVKRGMCSTLTNYIEDCRIELNDHCRFDGDLEDLHWYRMGESADEFEKDYEVGLVMNPWGYIMQTLQYNICEYRHFAINPHDYPEQHQMYNIAWDILNDGRFRASCKLEKQGSFTSYKLAVEIIEAWKKEAQRNIEGEMGEEEDSNEKNGQKGQGQGQGEGEGEGQGEASEVEDGKNKLFKNNGEDSGEKGEKSEEDNNSGGEKEDNKTESGPVIDKDGKRDIESEFNRDQEKEDGRYNIDPDDFNQKAADLAREEEPPTGNGEPTTSNSNEEVISSQSKSNKTNPKMNKVMKTPYIAYDVFDRMCYPALFPKNYEQIKESIQHKIRSVTREIARLIVAESQCRTHKFLKKGKIDRRRLHAVVKGDDRVFKKLQMGESKEVAIQLIIDLSGSMAGEKAKLAAQVACLFAEVLNAVNIPFEVIGYNTSAMPHEEMEKGKKNGFTRFDIVNHWIFKEFNESWSTVHSRLGACCNGMRTYFGASYINTDEIPLGKRIVRDIDGCVGGCNCDHETVLFGAQRLYAQPQERKIQIVIADGLPSGNYGDYGGQLQNMLVNVNNKVVKAGIEQVAFGIQCEGVKNYYSKTVLIEKLDDLGPQALKYLSKALLNHIMDAPDRNNT